MTTPADKSVIAALEHATASHHHPSCQSHGQPYRCSCHVEKARAALAAYLGRDHGIVAVVLIYGDDAPHQVITAEVFPFPADAVDFIRGEHLKWYGFELFEARWIASNFDLADADAKLTSFREAHSE